MIFWENIGVGACGPVQLASIKEKQYAVKMVCKFKSRKSAIKQLKNESLVFEYLENEKGKLAERQIKRFYSLTKLFVFLFFKWTAFLRCSFTARFSLASSWSRVTFQEKYTRVLT